MSNYTRAYSYKKYIKISYFVSKLQTGTAKITNSIVKALHE